MIPSPFLLQPATTAELGYVWDALSKQLARRECARWAEQPNFALPAELVQRRERTLARYLLAESFCLVAIPRDKPSADAPDLVCGFVIFDPLIQTVHYVYTGRNLRRLGIARLLITEATHGWEAIHASHLTKLGRAVAARLAVSGLPRVKYDPYRAFFSRDTLAPRPHADARAAASATTEAEPASGEG